MDGWRAGGAVRHVAAGGFQASPRAGGCRSRLAAAGRPYSPYFRRSAADSAGRRVDRRDAPFLGIAVRRARGLPRAYQGGNMSTATAPQTTSLQIRRTFAAPREKVFRAWT